MYAVKLIVIPVIIIVAAHFVKRAAAVIREFREHSVCHRHRKICIYERDYQLLRDAHKHIQRKAHRGEFRSRRRQRSPAAAAVNMTGSAAFE